MGLHLRRAGPAAASAQGLLPTSQCTAHSSRQQVAGLPEPTLLQLHVFSSTPGSPVLLPARRLAAAWRLPRQHWLSLATSAASRHPWSRPWWFF